jgi:hypothetical protein
MKELRLEADIREIKYEHLGINTMINYAPAGNRQAIQLGGAVGYYKFYLTLRRSRYEDVKPLIADLMAMQGRIGLIDLYVHELSNTSTGYGGLIKTKNTGEASWDINVYDMPPNTLILNKGEFIQIGSYHKAYMTREPLISDGAGEGLLQLTTPIVRETIADDLVKYRDVLFRVARAEDTITVDLDLYLRSGFELVFEEVWT